MPRRNQGPRLRWLDKRKCFYITWTEHGRSHERSTGTADREQAEICLRRVDASAEDAEPAQVIPLQSS